MPQGQVCDGTALATGVDAIGSQRLFAAAFKDLQLLPKPQVPNSIMNQNAILRAANMV